MSPAEAAALLGLPPSASRAAVNAAFRAGVRRCHPDVGGDADDLRRLVAARAILERRAPADAAIVIVRRTPWWRMLIAMLTRQRRAPRVR